MYKCNDCGNLFEEGEQKVFKENQGEFWGDSAIEEWAGCPRCGGAFEIVKPCQFCGSYAEMDNEENRTTCKSCKNKLLNRFNTAMCELFTPRERQVLNEILDGKEI